MYYRNLTRKRAQLPSRRILRDPQAPRVPRNLIAVIRIRALMILTIRDFVITISDPRKSMIEAEQRLSHIGLIMGNQIIMPTHGSSKKVGRTWRMRESGRNDISSDCHITSAAQPMIFTFNVLKLMKRIGCWIPSSRSYSTIASPLITE